MPDNPGPRVLHVETLKDPHLYSARQVRHSYLAAYMLENACGYARRLILTEPPDEHA